MAQWKKRFLPMALSCLCSMQGSVCLFGNDSSLKRQSTWNWPESQSVISKFEDFLGTMPNRSNTPSIKNRLADLSSLRGVTMLESVVALAAECEPSIAKLRELLSGTVSAQTVPDIDAALSSMMANGGIPSWMKSDVQLLACRVMVQNSLYDEALQRLKLIAVDQVSDPSTYLFYTAICQHHLLSREECLENLSRLLEREMELPTRYAITARLMEADIQPLKEDSLDEISRLMNDVERRLALDGPAKWSATNNKRSLINWTRASSNWNSRSSNNSNKESNSNSSKTNRPTGPRTPWMNRRLQMSRGRARLTIRTSANPVAGAIYLPPSVKKPFRI